jgi:DNA-binding Lrp family transcriptional regulator
MAMVTAFVLIDAEPASVADLAAALSDLPDVAEVYSVAGMHDLVAIVRVRHHDDLADVVTRHLAQLPGIVRTHTLVAFRSYSRHDLDAMWSIGSEDVDPTVATDPSV